MQELRGQECLDGLVKVNSLVSIYLSDPNSLRSHISLPLAPIFNYKCKIETIHRRQLLMFYCYWLILMKTHRSIFKYSNFHPHKLCDFLPAKTAIAACHSFPFQGSCPVAFQSSIIRKYSALPSNVQGTHINPQKAALFKFPKGEGMQGDFCHSGPWMQRWPCAFPALSSMTRDRSRTPPPPS